MQSITDQVNIINMENDQSQMIYANFKSQNKQTLKKEIERGYITEVDQEFEENDGLECSDLAIQTRRLNEKADDSLYGF